MWRRLSIPLLVALAVTPLGTPHTRQGTAGRRARGPNILIIVTDDQRADGTLQVMPRTRGLFQGGGTTFTNAFVTTPLCCPSRASIFTGRYVHNHGVARGTSPIDHRSTLHAKLRRSGYRTGIVGKFLNRWPVGRRPPYFDRWAIFDPLYQGPPYFGARFNVNGRVRRVPGYSTDFVSRTAISFLHRFEGDGDARPWLLYVTPFAPHGPATAPPRHEDVPVAPWSPAPSVFEADLSDKPRALRRRSTRPRQVRETRRSQLRSLVSVDEMVGDLYRALDRLGERDTLAFFLSDNGYLWGEHGAVGKRLPYTESVRVPFLMRWPGRVEAGSRDDRLVANIDVAPTALRAAGLHPSAAYPTDGRPLLGATRRDRILLEYTGPFHRWASIRTAEYQYVEHAKGRRRFREYYDLERDPWQMENLLADGDPTNDPDVRALAARLAADRRCGPRPGAIACP